MRPLFIALQHLLRRVLPAAWLFGHKHLGEAPRSGDTSFFRPPGLSLPPDYGVPESSKGRRPWWWLRRALRWMLTCAALTSAGLTAFRVLSVLWSSPPNPSGGARESQASAELWFGGCVTAVVAAAALVLWMLEWARSDRVRPVWRCACGYDRRGIAANAACPECGAPSANA